MLRLFLIAALAVAASEPALEKAERDYLAGRFRQACAGYRSAMRSGEDPVRSREGLLRALLKRDRLDEAVGESGPALARFPESALLHAAAGDVHFRRAEFETAEGLYRRALSIDPKHPRALLGMGRLRDTEFRHETAKRFLEQAFQRDPRDPDVVLGWSWSVDNRKERAALLRRWLVLAGNEDHVRRQEVASRIELLEALRDRQTFVLADPPAEARLPLGIVRDQKTKASALILRALVNAVACRMLLDTGASGLTLRRKAAEKAGLMRLASGMVRGVGDDGPGKAYSALAAQVEAGPLRFRDCVVSVVERTVHDSVDGIAGTDLFSDYVVTLDYPRRELRLSRPGPADAEGTHSTDREIPRKAHWFAGLRRFGHLLLVPAKLNSHEAGWFAVDSGAFASMTTLRAVKDKAAVRPVDKLQLRGASGRVTSTWATGRITVEFAGVKQEKPSLLAVDLTKMNRLLGAEISGLIGQDILQGLATAIDYRKGLIMFQEKEK